MLSFVSRSARRLVTPADDGPAALVARLVAGDITALEAIYRLEAGAVYRYALALCGNAAWAADATQEAFVALAERPGAFDAARGALGAYLSGVARHALLACNRRARGEVPLDLEGSGESGDDTIEPPAATADLASPEALLVREQSSARVWAALRALPWSFREALVLVDLQDRPYAEAAAIAGIELNTLRTRVHRARLKLAQALGRAAGDST